MEMKKLALITSLALLSPQLMAQEAKPADTAAPKKANEPTERYKKAINAFSNLPEETRVEFLKKRNEAGVLFQNKRIFEALEATRELNEIFPDDPQVINLRGACYVELRDFPKAMEQFILSKEITGPSLNVVFNIGEVAFVSGDWKKSLEIFTEALSLAPEKAMQMKRLVEFKIMLSHIGLSKDESLSADQRQQHAKKAKELAALYDFRDDSPYYYYANAALQYSLDNKDKGLEYLNKGRRVYSGSAQTIASWEDTMTEFGYIKSYYGNEQKNTSPEQ
ncbi:tetratricopeptide repeat protein [Rubritalea tangerina]|uniref:Tetratricopeptide repeat protein n=1 Tax=Rubritalea tangerina TaxID=430798 RepID=A0ABW4Z923_9BACT